MMIFLAAIIGIYSVQFFYLNFTIQGLNRAVISTPIELFYQDIKTVSGEGKFTTEQIREHLDDYYSKSLGKYVKNYEVDYYFYVISDHSMCVEQYCNAVEITVDADLILTYKYHRVMYYELYRSKNG